MAMVSLAGGCSSGYNGAATGVDRERLKRDRAYLLAVAGHQLQHVTLTKHRGLITFAAFQKALGEVGLRYGQPEVDEILQYCTITEDGYVHYGDLLRTVAPEVGHVRARQNSAKVAIFPAEELGPRRPFSTRHADAAIAPPTPAGRLRSFLAEHTEDIRKVYARWESGMLSNESFMTELSGMGIAVTGELEKYLCVYGPSRGMPFGKLMYALQAGEDDGRRARVPHGGRQQWGHADLQRGDSGADGGGARCSSMPSAPPSVVSGGGEPEAPPLRQAIADFLDGRVPAVAFRRQLGLHGVQATPSLERLIRTHELDSSVRFQDMACVLLRQDKLAEQLDARGGPATAYGGGGAVGSATTTPSVVGAVDREGSARQLAWPEPSPAGSGPGFEASRQPPRASSRGSSRAADAAMGGVTPPVRATWSDATKSVASRPRDAAASAAASDAASPAPPLQDQWEVRPPFATVQELQDTELQMSLRSSQRNAPNTEALRSRGNSGDIIGWNDRPLVQAAKPPRSNQEHFLRWPEPKSQEPVSAESAISSEASPDQSRFGKRYFGQTLPANECTPYGRDMDTGFLGPQRQLPRKPFGTDQDLHLRRPEDAGTDEYRAAVRETRRVLY